MDALLMCGGRGTRLDRATDGRTEKPLVEVRGVPMVERTLAALRGSRAETVHLVTSPHAPDTRTHLTTRIDNGATYTSVTMLDAPGDGYVPDLQYALDRVPSPVLTVACDLPLLAPVVVNRVLDRAEGSSASLAVCVPAALKRLLGASTDATWERGARALAPTGLNVVNEDRRPTKNAPDDARATHDHSDDSNDDAREDGTERIYVSYDARLAVNVNRPADLVIAEALCE